MSTTRVGSHEHRPGRRGSRPPAALTGGIRVEPAPTLGSISPDDCALPILPGGSAWDAGRQGIGRRSLARLPEAFVIQTFDRPIYAV